MAPGFAANGHFRVDTVQKLNDDKFSLGGLGESTRLVVVDDNGRATKDDDFDDFYSFVSTNTIDADLDMDIDDDGVMDEQDEKKETDPGASLLKGDADPNTTEPDDSATKLAFPSIDAPGPVADAAVTTNGSQKLRLWTKDGSGNWVKEDDKVTWQTDDTDPVIWVEGMDTGEASLNLKITHDGTTTTEDTIDVTLGEIDLSWMTINSSLGSNPKTGGGEQIYPGKPDPDSNGGPYNTVKVKAEVSDGVSGDVTFEAFDVDDPSANEVPIDDESNSADNRGDGTSHGVFVDSNGNSLGRSTSVQVSNGTAVATFRVSMQPGDNYRIVGALESSFMNGLAAEQDVKTGEVIDTNNNDKRIDPNHSTSMLTVWREVHIERDTMGAIENNFVSGDSGTDKDIEQVTYEADANHTKVVVGSDQDETDRFENGIFTVNGTGYDIVDAIRKTQFANVGDTFYLTGDQTNNIQKGDGWKAVDDDFQGNIPLPNVNGITNAVSGAYLSPIYDLENPNQDIDFDKHVSPVATNTPHFSTYSEWDSRIHNAPDYWVAYVLNGFEGAKDYDKDPNHEDSGIYGFTEGRTSNNVPGPGQGGSLVYWERHQPHENPVGNVQTTVWHELGHALSRTGHGPKPKTDPWTLEGESTYTPRYLDNIRYSEMPWS